MRTCVLRSLANPMLKGLILGLEAKDSDLSIKEGFFPCCAGSGEFFDQKRDAVLRCGIAPRLAAVQKLFQAYEKSWGQSGAPGPHAVNTNTENTLLSEASDTLKGYRAQANVHNGVLKTPSKLWALALASAWRFGAEVYFRTMTEPSPHLFPTTALIKGDKPLAIFLEQVGHLWEPRLAYEFESLVSFAYKTNSFLWVEFAREPDPSSVVVGPAAKELSSGAAFGRRISALKNKSPVDHLTPGCRSILDQMCRLPRATF